MKFKPLTEFESTIVQTIRENPGRDLHWIAHLMGYNLTGKELPRRFRQAREKLRRRKVIYMMTGDYSHGLVPYSTVRHAADLARHRQALEREIEYYSEIVSQRVASRDKVVAELEALA